MAAERTTATRRWRGPPAAATKVVGRRLVQCAIDVVASSVVPLLSLALFPLVPVSPDGTTVSVTGLAFVATVVTAVGIVVPLWYWVIHPARHRGQTWGMQVLRIRVVRVNGLPVGTKHLVVRWLMLAVDGLGLGAVGLVAMLASPRHQRLGDLVAGTVVVRDPD